jgi:starch synthase
VKETIFVNRLTHQKMADVVHAALPLILASGLQFALHCQGDRSLEAAFAEAARDHTPQFAARIGYDEDFARRLTAAADMSLTASRFEPCGLTTMYAMRYGALPVTRHVGGVTDTVVDADSEPAGDEGANGIVFDKETPGAMVDCVRRAGHWFDERDWAGMQQSAMRRDFGWERSAQSYLDLYRELRPMAFARPVSLAQSRQLSEANSKAA